MQSISKSIERPSFQRRLDRNLDDTIRNGDSRRRDRRGEIRRSDSGRSNRSRRRSGDPKSWRNDAGVRLSIDDEAVEERKSEKGNAWEIDVPGRTLYSVSIHFVRSKSDERNSRTRSTRSMIHVVHAVPRLEKDICGNRNQQPLFSKTATNVD